MGRGFHRKSLIPGRVHGNIGSGHLCILFGDMTREEYIYEEYDTLVGCKARWVAESNGNLPGCAFPG